MSADRTRRSDLISATVFISPRSPERDADVGFDTDTRAPSEFHRTLPGFAVTPLVSVESIARELGVRAVILKDEGERAGLPSFKILGASWASAQAIHRHWLSDDPSIPMTFDAIRDALTAKRVSEPAWRGTLAAATDGNHGRGVARFAALMELECIILVPSGTAAARVAAIEGEGATVIVVDGTYDDAIAESARLGTDDTLVISDTSWEGYTDTPRDVIDGYSTMFYEIDDGILAARLPQPTHIVLQAGVGAFAAAGLRHYRGASLFSVIVEPSSANCLMESMRAGEMSFVPGPHTSSMAGLNCGMPSLLAWPVIHNLTDAFIAIDDDALGPATRMLAQEGIESGESGVAGAAGLLAAAGMSTGGRWRVPLHLTEDSVILLVSTEGATDPAHYQELLG